MAKTYSKLQLASSMTDFNHLSPSVSVYRPASGLSTPHSTAPELILLATWMDARDVHIAKYIARYQALYPAACILLVKSFFRYYFNPSSARRELLPAVEVIHNVLDHSSPSLTTKTNRPRMLVHLFSNGGSCMLYYLYDVYSEASAPSLNPTAYKDGDTSDPDRSRLLPPHVTIFDSVPGRWSYSGSTQSVLLGLPSGIIRNLLSVVVHLLGMWWVIKYIVLKIPEETHVWGLAHNDPNRAREICRSYVYSEADELVYYGDVEKHADHAESNAYVVVRKVKFLHSQHVAHARSHPEEYWALVKETWDAGEKDGAWA
jgi:Eukaryotic protein of unknown function (DUF829)